MKGHDIARHERVEMYLKAVFTIQTQAPPVTLSKVAAHLGVSTPSAHEMLGRLQAAVLIQVVPEGYRLTDEGERRASRVVRRLRLAERLLTDVLHLDLPQVYAEACKLEHVIGGEVETRLAEVLGHPTSCPHGLPIPAERGRREDEESPRGVGLDTLAVGQRARVLAIPEEDAPVVAYLWVLGLHPQAEVEVREVAPFDGPITCGVGDRVQALGRSVASRVRVHPLS